MLFDFELTLSDGLLNSDQKKEGKMGTKFIHLVRHDQYVTDKDLKKLVGKYGLSMETKPYFDKVNLEPTQAH